MITTNQAMRTVQTSAIRTLPALRVLVRFKSVGNAMNDAMSAKILENMTSALMRLAVTEAQEAKRFFGNGASFRVKMVGEGLKIECVEPYFFAKEQAKCQH